MYNLKKEPDKKIIQVPVLIAARNEKIFITRTLASIVRSIGYYHESIVKLFPESHTLQFFIIICDNNSTDNTTQEIQGFIEENHKQLEQFKINIHIRSESKRGKIYALQNLINYIETSRLINFDHVIFTDADVQWELNMYYELINHKITHPAVQLIGTRLVANNKKVNFWGKLELFPYYGYGESFPGGHGKFFGFISGMGYLADGKVLGFLKNDIPPVIGNEDVALSILVRKKNIHILNKTCIYYYVANNLKQFIQIRGRHIRELYRISKWLKERNKFDITNPIHAHHNKKKYRNYILKSVRKRFYSISENRMLPYFTRFYQSKQKFHLFKKSNGFYEWLKSIPAFQLGLSFILFYHPMSLLIYFIMKIVSYIQFLFYNKPGWESIRSFQIDD